MDPKASSTIGYELRHNDLLAEEDEARFVERSLAGLGPQPPNFRAIVEMNRGPLLTSGVEVLPLTPRQVEERRRAGSLIVDVRTDLQFDDAHIPDAVAITMLRAGFGSRLAWIADPDQGIVLVGRDDEDGRLAARLAAAVGIRNLEGFLSGGMTSWRAEGRPVERVARLDATELPGALDSDPEIQVVDVREASEWREGHLPGSVHVPYHDIDSLPEGIDPERSVAAICSSGQRSAVAASLLRRHGAERVIHVVNGGVPALARRGVELERAEEG
jgi:hydroxyacylglutathione hydrolase